MKIQLAVLDMAGTTVTDNGEINQAFRAAFQQQGITVPAAAIDTVMGYHKAEAIRLMLAQYNTGNTDPETLIPTIHEQFTQTLLQVYNHADLQPQPFAEELFEWLHQQGIKIALNTGFTRQITDTILRKLGWDKSPWIDAVICSDEVPRGRPHPFMIRHLMQQFGIAEAAAVCKCGDTSVDIEEGRQAGCGLVVAVTTGAFPAAALLPYQPDAIIDSLETLPALIRETYAATRS